MKLSRADRLTLAVFCIFMAVYSLAWAVIGN